MSDIISWDKAIDKKVKSSDNKDLGKVQSITREYIQTKEGVVSKNYYFIPKYYFQGYDGDNLWTSLTKDEVKTRFERESAPDISEIETPDYETRKNTMTRQHPDFANNIPSYSQEEPADTSPYATAASSQDKGVPMAWDKMIDKKVKSSDDQDMGKVESISADYVEVKEGTVSKKHYYLPKYFIQGYDGDKLHASLTKNEIKDRYERDSPPHESELQSQEYLERKRKVDSAHPQFLHGVPVMADEPGVKLADTSGSGRSLNIPWEEVIHKHVRTTDNIDIGDIEKVGNEFIVVREGVVKIHLYYIPKSYINNYDGSYLYVNAPSGLVSAKFERSTEPTPEEVRMLGEEGRDTTGYEGGRTYEEGAPGTEKGRKDDPLTSYRDKEPMTPAKIKEHEPTAVRRDPSDQKIIEPGQRSGTSSEEAAEIARKKGMAKGTAGAAETGSEYEQDTSGTNE